jgi:hypothetical protein
MENTKLDLKKSGAFAERMIGVLNSGALAFMTSIGHQTGIFDSFGTFLMQDVAASSHVFNNIDHPVGPLLYTISCMHCMTVSLSKNGAGLGAMWGEEKACEMLREAGFTRIDVKKLPHDFQNSYYIVKK